MRSKNKVIHALTILVFTLLMSGTTKADNKMIPLADLINIADVTNQKLNPTTLVYAYERCSGLYTSLYFASQHASFDNFQNDEMQQMGATQLEASVLTKMVAQRIAEKAGLNLTMEQISKTALTFGEKYHDIMNDEYERTGILISGLVVEDFETCHALREAVAKQW